MLFYLPARLSKLLKTMDQNLKNWLIIQYDFVLFVILNATGHILSALFFLTLYHCCVPARICFHNQSLPNMGSTNRFGGKLMRSVSVDQSAVFQLSLNSWSPPADSHCSPTHSDTPSHADPPTALLSACHDSHVISSISSIEQKTPAVGDADPNITGRLCLGNNLSSETTNPFQ